MSVIYRTSSKWWNRGNWTANVPTHVCAISIIMSHLIHWRWVRFGNLNKIFTLWDPRKRRWKYEDQLLGPTRETLLASYPFRWPRTCTGVTTDLGKDHHYLQQRREFLVMHSDILPALTSLVFRAPQNLLNVLLAPIYPPVIYPPFLVHPESHIYRVQ